MGLFSGIKKAFKKVFKGVKKVFKKVMKPVAKVLSNKWVKMALMGVSLFTGAGALMTMFQGGFKSGLANLGTAVMDKVASAGTFLKQLPSKIMEAPGAIKDFFAGNAAAGSESGNILAENATSGAEKMLGGAPSAADLSNSADLVSGASKVGEAAEVAGKAAEVGAGASADSLSKSADLVSGSTNVGGQEAPQGLLSKVGGGVKKAGQWMEDHPNISKIGMDMVSGMTEENPEAEHLQWRRDRQDDRDRFFADYNPDVSVDSSRLQAGLQQGNQAVRDQGLIARQRLRVAQR